MTKNDYKSNEMLRDTLKTLLFRKQSSAESKIPLDKYLQEKET